jgi:hypothetical protein
METINDYLPLIIGSLSAIIGIRGFTWDASKTGIHALTKWGYLAIFLTFISLLMATLNVQKRNDEISDVRKIRKLVNREILKNVRYLITPFVRIDNQVYNADSSTINFEILADKNTLAKLLKAPLMLREDRVLGIDEQPYKSDSLSIVQGEGALHDLLQTFGSFLDIKTVIALQDLLNDDFLRSGFAFRDERKKFIPEIKRRINDNTLSDSLRNLPGWNTHNFYYSSNPTRGVNTNRFENLSLLIKRIKLLFVRAKGSYE